MINKFLPINKEDLKKRGWGEVDIIIVTGDAYVDHPSFGAALIGRVLESAGFRVGIIAQPNWRNVDDFRVLGQPRLFWAITSGNLDSMVANYTPNKTLRKNDQYSPGAKAGQRPDRAVIAYANRVQQAYDAPIVIGGLEASMRRLGHYDWFSDKVRRSIIIDSKADILVYGMAELAILKIAQKLNHNPRNRNLDNILGTVVIRKSLDKIKDYRMIPSYEEIASDKNKFNQAFKTIYPESNPFQAKTIVQKHDNRFVVQFPPQIPLTENQMDKIYQSKWLKAWHPIYEKKGGVPALEPIKFSITSHRGCFGECSFCSLYSHQGRIIQSRSLNSIIDEIKELTNRPDFNGTISDIGGPTVNFYKATCSLWADKGPCRDKRCLTPKKCSNLKIGYDQMLAVWKKAGAIPKIKHIFVGSGVRYDLLTENDSDEYLKQLCLKHVSGRLKIAPEHISSSVLNLMNKPGLEVYKKFVSRFNKVCRESNRKLYLVNYLINSHPGAGLEAALELALYLKENHIKPEQVQDYMPLPMTLSAAMYYTGRHPLTGKKVYVARNPQERKTQRALAQYFKPGSRKYIREALKVLNKKHLEKSF